MILGDFHILKMRSFHWNVAFPIRFSAAQCGFRQEGLMKSGPGRSRHQLMGLVSPVIHGLKPRNGDLPESSLSIRFSKVLSVACRKNVCSILLRNFDLIIEL